MCLGMDLTVLKEQPDVVVKDLIYACQKDHGSFLRPRSP